MNNSWWCLPVCICALGATPVAAQGARPQFGFGIGASIPTGAFRSDTTGEGFAGGWLFTGHVTLRAPLRLQRLRLRIDAGVARHDANDRLKADLTTAFGQPADEHMTLLGADANVVYPSSVSVSVGGASTNTSATKLGWQLGSEVTSGPIFLELRYVMIAAAKGYPRVSFFPVTLGARFGKRGTTP